MRLTRASRSEALIPTASMADIAFLLIIFFMVTTVHELDRTSVNLPLAKIREEAEKGAAIVVISKPDQNAEEYVYKFSDGSSTSKAISGPEDIYLEASQITYGDDTHQFILKADGYVRFEKVDEVLDAMRRASVSRVLLLTAQNTVQGEGAEATP